MSRFVRPTGAVLLLALTAACQGGGTGSAARIPADSTEYYRTQTQQLSTISAQKDSLLTELSETTKLITDVSAELATIRCPVLALYGEDSELLDRGERIGRTVPGCEVRLFPGCTHLLLWEATEALKEQLVAWVRR